jgi:hypothetical protein
VDCADEADGWEDEAVGWEEDELEHAARASTPAAAAAARYRRYIVGPSFDREQGDRAGCLPGGFTRDNVISSYSTIPQTRVKSGVSNKGVSTAFGGSHDAERNN